MPGQAAAVGLYRLLAHEHQKRHCLLELKAKSYAYIVCYTSALTPRATLLPAWPGLAEDKEELPPASERACKAADDIMGALVTPYFLAA